MGDPVIAQLKTEIVGRMERSVPSHNPLIGHPLVSLASSRSQYSGRPL